MMMFFKFICGIVFLLISNLANADGLKVFGPEFCKPYDAGTCINFNYKDLKDSKTWTGDFKYPRGRKAYDECAAKSDGTDGALVYCSMVFHREEQSAAKRAEMCQKSVRERYFKTITSNYAMGLYDSVWGCNKE